MSHAFRQVDVFSSDPLGGNPVAVVHDADDLSDDRMAAFARWTNLSETTFLLRPTEPGADYRLRIFTPGGELPFAGHPTLGSAHAWLEAGGVARGERLVQECGVGLVEVDRADGRLAFRAPPLLRGGPVEEADLAPVVAALGLAPDQVVDAQWCDNGPGWLGIRLHDAAAVLAVHPRSGALGQMVGLVGLHPVGSETAAEVRALCTADLGIVEDPVTGSLNAAVAQWLIADGTLPPAYVASQGAAVGRTGRIHVQRDAGEAIWVGGHTRTTICGTVDLS